MRVLKAVDRVQAIKDGRVVSRPPLKSSWLAVKAALLDYPDSPKILGEMAVGEIIVRQSEIPAHSPLAAP
jgi:hypothetical protein